MSSLKSLEQSDLLLAAWALVHHVTARLSENEEAVSDRSVDELGLIGIAKFGSSNQKVQNQNVQNQNVENQNVQIK